MYGKLTICPNFTLHHNWPKYFFRILAGGGTCLPPLVSYAMAIIAVVLMEFDDKHPKRHLHQHSGAAVEL